MSERQVPETHKVQIEDISLSPAAVAVLEFTSDIRDTTRAGEISYICSKDAFIWAGLAVLIATYRSVRFPPLDDLKIKAELYEQINGSSDWFSQLNHLESVKYIRGDLDFQEYQRYTASFLIKNVLKAFVAMPVADGYPTEASVGEINRIVKEGYEELIRASLITDPIIEATLSLAILSILPFSIVKRTKNGRTVYRKVQAALWKYEHQRRSGGATEINLTFEAARIARALKTGIIAAYHDATKGAGEEPEE
jgi:hypothetical protein